MNKVIITIKTGNAAFVDSPPGHEIARILRRMADEFELSNSAQKPYDINGAAVGTVVIQEDSE